MIKIIISVLFVIAAFILLYRLVVATYWHVQGMKLRRHLDMFDKENADFIVSSFEDKENNK